MSSATEDEALRAKAIDYRDLRNGLLKAIGLRDGPMTEEERDVVEEWCDNVALKAIFE